MCGSLPASEIANGEAIPCAHTALIVGQPSRRSIQRRAALRRTARGGRGILAGMRLGIAHHLGWAVAVTASADHKVVDRRRIELIEPGMPTAPIHHEGKPLDDDRHGGAGRRRCGRRRFERRQPRWTSSPPQCPSRSSRCRSEPGRSTSRKTSPSNVGCHMRAAPTPSCTARCWPSSHAHAAGMSTSTTPRTWRPERSASWPSEADEVLLAPRATMGPPWAKDHRMALAATIVAS